MDALPVIQHSNVKVQVLELLHAMSMSTIQVIDMCSQKHSSVQFFNALVSVTLSRTEQTVNYY